MAAIAREYFIIAVVMSVLLVPQALGAQSISPSVQSENNSAQSENQTTNEVVGWQTYEDSEDGFKIQYPQEWKKYITPVVDLSDFSISPDANSNYLDTTLLSIYAKKVTKTLDPATLKVQQISLESYADDLIRSMTSPLEEKEPTVIKNEATTVRGNPAWRLDYIYNNRGEQISYSSIIFVDKDDKHFEIGLRIPPLKVEEMRPVGEKIMQTFQFIGNSTFS